MTLILVKGHAATPSQYMESMKMGSVTMTMRQHFLGMAVCQAKQSSHQVLPFGPHPSREPQPLNPSAREAQRHHSVEAAAQGQLPTRWLATVPTQETQATSAAAHLCKGDTDPALPV
jgi:hypothetical protein